MRINLYRKGADKERRVVKEAREKGMIAFRSAGSHSPIDVCIINVEHKQVRFIQCKAGASYTDNFKKKLEEKYKLLNDEFLVSFEVL